jgi:hypothetical protein
MLLENQFGSTSHYLKRFASLSADMTTMERAA